MYHISKDKRAIASAERIAEGLLSCSKQFSFTEITIPILLEKSSVSRATFYRLFDRIEDVLQYLCDRAVRKEFDYPVMFLGKWPKTFLLCIIGCFMEEDALTKMLAESDNFDLIRNSLKCYTDEIISCLMIANMKKRRKDFVIENIIGMIPFALEMWVKNGKKETRDELYNELLGTVLFTGKLMEILE